MADFIMISLVSSEGSNFVPIHRLAEYFVNEPLERAKAPHTPRQVRMSAGLTRARPGHRLPLTEERMRMHAWLNERLAALDYERHGLWPRAKRFFRAIVRRMLRPLVRKERS
jgi:hypothetical protein